MTFAEEFTQLLNRHLNPLLDDAQLAIASDTQYQIFRKRVLNQFGKSGFQGELLELVAKFTEKGKAQE